MVLQDAPPRHHRGRNQLNHRPHRTQQTRQRGHHGTKFFAPSIAVRASLELEASLKENKWMPSPGDDGERQRKRALHILEKTLCQWASNLESSRPASDNRWQRPRVTLITFGSYRLQAYRPDADLDVLALCPPICTRGDFFTSLLKLMETEADISDVHPIPSAFTPVIKLKIHSIHVDLLFGRVSDAAKLIQHQQKGPSPLASSLPTEGTTHDQHLEYIIDDSDLQGLDESGVRSMNGVRVTQYLLTVVPNVHHFRVTLCSVKAWANTHGIYSNVLGFLGGINYAIMVAWVCRRYPNHQPTSLLRTFFRVFATWDWSQPVTLAKPQSEPPAGVAWMPAWNPDTNPRDKRHLMPIITPVFPSMNSAYNTGVPQKRRIQEEMIRAAYLMEHGDTNWRAIFQPSDFFNRHANFLQITIRAGNSEDFMKWFRLCESRLRILIGTLEGSEISAWPFARFMKREFIARGNQSSGSDCVHEALFFIGLRFTRGVGSFNLKQCTSEFLYNHINSWEERKPGMDVMLAHVIQGDLPFDLINKNLIHDNLLNAAADEGSLEHDAALAGSGGAVPSVPVAQELPRGKRDSDDSSKGSSRRAGTPVEEDRADNDDDCTRLTPKLARSTISNIDLVMMSPTKRPRNNPSLD